MIQILAIVRDTFRELLVRKALIGFLIVNALALVGIALYVNGDMFAAFSAKAGVPLTDEMKTQMVGIVEVGIAAFFEVLLIFVSVFTTASVLPTMLEKGTVDLYLSKPMSRSKLLFGKILGSLTVVTANIAVFIFGAWIILSLKLGVWNTGFLEAGVVMLFSFVVLYGIIALLNVVTRSGTLGIIVVYAHVLAISGILANRVKIAEWMHNESVASVLNVLYYILPQTSDQSKIASSLIIHADVISWTPIWCSAIIAAVAYGSAAFLFEKKDY